MAAHEDASSLSPKSERCAARLPNFRLLTTALCGVCLLALLVSAPAGTAHAQEPVAAQQHSATQSATRIEVDEEAGVIRFFIDGEEKAWLDDRGLFVRGFFRPVRRDVLDPDNAEAGGANDAP